MQNKTLPIPNERLMRTATGTIGIMSGIGHDVPKVIVRHHDEQDDHEYDITLMLLTHVDFLEKVHDGEPVPYDSVWHDGVSGMFEEAIQDGLLPDVKFDVSMVNDDDVHTLARWYVSGEHPDRLPSMMLGYISGLRHAAIITTILNRLIEMNADWHDVSEARYQYTQYFDTYGDVGEMFMSVLNRYHVYGKKEVENVLFTAMAYYMSKEPSESDIADIVSKW